MEKLKSTDGCIRKTLKLNNSELDVPKITSYQNASSSALGFIIRHYHLIKGNQNILETHITIYEHSRSLGVGVAGEFAGVHRQTSSVESNSS